MLNHIDAITETKKKRKANEQKKCLTFLDKKEREEKEHNTNLHVLMVMTAGSVESIAIKETWPCCYFMQQIMKTRKLKMTLR